MKISQHASVCEDGIGEWAAVKSTRVAFTQNRYGTILTTIKKIKKTNRPDLYRRRDIHDVWCPRVLFRQTHKRTHGKDRCQHTDNHNRALH